MLVLGGRWVVFLVWVWVVWGGFFVRGVFFYCGWWGGLGVLVLFLCGLHHCLLLLRTQKRRLEDEPFR